MWAEPWSPMPSAVVLTSPREALEFDPATGLRIYNEVGLGIPRKNTKSTMASAAGLYMLDADGESEPEVYVAAAGGSGPISCARLYRRPQIRAGWRWEGSAGRSTCAVWWIVLRRGAAMIHVSAVWLGCHRLLHPRSPTGCGRLSG